MEKLFGAASVRQRMLVPCKWFMLGARRIISFCDARHGTEFSGESPPWAELKRFTSLDKGKFVVTFYII